jgi:hypothetical protein
MLILMENPGQGGSLTTAMPSRTSSGQPTLWGGDTAAAERWGATSGQETCCTGDARAEGETTASGASRC